ncbi:hypothetical protein OOU_Y34scaffold00030g2 [Pyricularia oryzae Y34]|uniref:Uncharacterized protein n=1 Tax=Pyricularia oryzae (strain Y34) TaxID=1143189 RepID=A0AA97PAL6_PYRO3|nr:hypothetical protein OOU_Y34scaffold00030g2 [Pyricularia oryzae Y34]
MVDWEKSRGHVIAQIWSIRPTWQGFLQERGVGDATEASIGLICSPGIDIPGTLQDWSRMVGDMLFATSNSRPQNIWKVALLDTGMSVCSKSFDSFYAPWSVDQDFDSGNTPGHLESAANLDQHFEQFLGTSGTSSTNAVFPLASPWNDWDYEMFTCPTQTYDNSTNRLLSTYPIVQSSDASGIDNRLLTTPTYIPQPHKLPSPQFHRPAKHGFVEDASGPAKRTKMGKQSSGGRISCPYFKRFPEVFCSRRTCLGPGFDGMNRLNRCGMDFGDSKRLDEHMRALEPCFAVDLRPDQGFISHPQWNEIQTNRKHGVEVEDKWRQIYLVLFPDADPSAIPGPYFNGFATSSDGRIHATNKC